MDIFNNGASTIYGGLVSLTTNKTLMYGIIIILCIFVAYTLYRFFVRVRENAKYSSKEQARRYFNDTHGDTDDKYARRAIHAGEQIENPTAVDHYRMGQIYLINQNDYINAHKHFNEALKQIRNNHIDIRRGFFVLDGIADYYNRFVDHTELEELPIQAALLDHYNNVRDVINIVAKQRKEIKADDNLVQQALINRKYWESDSQNVHDSALFAELKHQLRHIQDENNSYNNSNIHTYEEVSNWLLMRYKDDTPKYNKVRKVLKLLDNNYPLDGTDIHEQDIIVAVWRRAHDPRNAASLHDIKEAIGDCVLDCIEGGHVVCIAGRSAKIWQALAKLDDIPTAGILRTKQTMRNEIYERAAKIVDKYVGVNGSVNDDLKKAYQNSDRTAAVEELEEMMRDEIAQIRKDYEGRLDNEQLTLIIRECCAVV